MSFQSQYAGDFINGKWIPVVKGDGSFKDISPADLNDLIMTVPYAYAHVDQAVEAARKAYPVWAKLTLEERKKHLLKLKETFESMKQEMAEAISRDTGKPLWEGLTEAGALTNKIDITLNFP